MQPNFIGIVFEEVLSLPPSLPPSLPDSLTHSLTRFAFLAYLASLASLVRAHTLHFGLRRMRAQEKDANGLKKCVIKEIEPDSAGMLVPPHTLPRTCLSLPLPSFSLPNSPVCVPLSLSLSYIVIARPHC